jgi:serine/threonine protein kinase
MGCGATTATSAGQKYAVNGYESRGNGLALAKHGVEWKAPPLADDPQGEFFSATRSKQPPLPQATAATMEAAPTREDDLRFFAMGEFTSVQVLDETRNSTIVCLREKRTGRLVAGKRAQKNLAQSEANYRNEVRMLHSLRHCPSVVSLLGVCEIMSELWIMLELYGGGNLVVWLERFPSSAQDCALQFFDSVEGLHSMMICHLDLKPNNVLFDDSGRLRLCDFATARLLDTPGQLLQGSSSSVSATDYYKAPEASSGKAYCGFKSDTYSAGKTLQCIAKVDGTWCARSPAFNELTSHHPERRPTLAAARATCTFSAASAGGGTSSKGKEAAAMAADLGELLLELSYEPWATNRPSASASRQFTALPPFGLATGAQLTSPAIGRAMHERAGMFAPLRA